MKIDSAMVLYGKILILQIVHYLQESLCIYLNIKNIKINNTIELLRY